MMAVKSYVVFTTLIIYTVASPSLTYWRQGRQTAVILPAPADQPVTLLTGPGCGTVQMKAYQVIQVNSSNFGVANANYYNNEACTWTFKATDCALSVYCPCFKVPSSVGCLRDYLSIDHLHFHDKFCGENRPIGVYRATSDFLSLKFRSDYKGTDRGFKCNVRCTATGVADAIVTNDPCPTGTTNPFGSPM